MNNTLPWHEIETVLLDMDGTLLDLHFDNHFWQQFLPEHYSQKHGFSEQKSFYDLAATFAAKKGSLDWYSVDYWSKAFDLDLAALKLQHTHNIQYRPYCLEFLDFLKQKNIERVLVTNAHRISLDIKMQTCSLVEWIPHRYSSHDFGLPKEHPDFWPIFSKTFPFNKERTLFIDDTDAVLKSAERYGIQHLRSIKWPDSTQTKPNSSIYPMIDSFLDIMV